MRDDTKIYKELYTCELDNSDPEDDEYTHIRLQQLLDSVEYYSTNGKKLVSLLTYLRHNKNIEFSIIQGFKGKGIFDKTNKFKTCTIKLKNIKDVDKVLDLIDKFESYDYTCKSKKSSIRIQVKE